MYNLTFLISLTFSKADLHINYYNRPPGTSAVIRLSNLTI